MNKSSRSRTNITAAAILMALAILLITSVLAVAAAPLPANETQDEIPNQYIITYKSGVMTTATSRAGTRNLVTMFGGQVFAEYSHAINGFSARLTPTALAVLKSNPNIESVEADKVVSVDPREMGASSADVTQPVTSFALDFSTSSVQNVTDFHSNLWGLDRIDQNDLPLNGTYGYNNIGSSIHVYVIDTGILPTHSEFGSRASADYVVSGYGTAIDCNGHGTHVSGTIGGTNVGVAKGVRLHGVKVLDCDGNGTDSSVIAGINYVIANHQDPAVINMSVGGGYSSSLNTAVQNAINAGITVVVAAGNEEDDACYYSPSSAANAITVGGTERNDRFIAYAWNFWFGSNYGTCVDINAPGYYVYSSTSDSNTAYASYSGTSMASPHVAGVAALYLQDHLTATPAQVRSALITQAVDTNISYLPAGTPDLFLNTQFTVAPIAVSPTGSIQDNPPTFVWNEFGGSSQYNLVITQGVSTIYNQNLSASTYCSAGQCSFTYPSNLSAGTYDWKVRGYMAATTTWTAYNNATSFTLSGTIPTPVSPEGLVTDTTPGFTFTDIGASSYKIKVLDGTTEVYIYEYTPSGCVGTCTASPTTALSLDTDYTWAVSAYINSLWTDYSVAKALRVVELTPTGPTAPNSNGLPTLNWEEEPDATGYAYQVLSGATIVRSGTVTSSACISGTCSAQITSALANGSYTWKFNTTINGYTSEYSDPMDLIIYRPTLSAPSGTITNKTPAFTFTALSGATDYLVTLMQGATVMNVEEFSGASCTSTCSFQFTSYEIASGSYTWYINAKYNGEWSMNSSSQSFTAVILSLTSPSGTTLDTKPIYTWEAVPGATYYQYEVYRGTTLLFNRKVVPSAVCSGDVCSHNPGVTLKAAAHSWRMRAKVNGVWTIYSDKMAFTVAALTLNSPKGTITTAEPVFNWSIVPGATEYELVADDRAPVSLLASDCVGSCSFTFTSDPFTSGPHTWKVRMLLNGEWTAYSSPVSFNVLIFNLLSPTGTVNSGSPIYSWEEIPGATYYQYQVYKGTTLKFSKKVYPIDVCAAGVCSHNSGVSLADGNYTWRLQAKINGVWTVYSSSVPFTVLR